MKKIVLTFALTINFLFCKTLLHSYLKIFSNEQKFQRQHIEQMYFDTAYDWSAWGILNAAARNNFVGSTHQVFEFVPQVAVDRYYPVSLGEMIIGADVNGGGGKFSQDEESAIFGGYGVGGYLALKTQSYCFFSLSTKMVQIFQNAHNQLLNNILWLIDAGVGKRFFLPQDYFIETRFHFGFGVILDSHYSYMQNAVPIGIDSQTGLPFNFLGIFSMGKKFEKSEVKISLAPMLDVYAKGKIFQQLDNQIVSYDNQPNFDLLLSIAYDVKMGEKSHFYTYVDFHALKFDVIFGLGFRLGFGEHKYKPLQYPNLKIPKLKKTYLK